jgi:electron transfer flavoprotein alpha/beta subunit
MNILVCFKIVPDVEMLTEEDWVIDKNLQIDTSFLKPSLNSYDESALEIALTLSDASESARVPVELNALTVADSSATTILKTLNALRFRRVVRIDSLDDLRFRPLAIASILAQYVLKHAHQDVLLLGRQTSIGENARTHLLVAEMLGWPCITQAIRIELVDMNHLMVTSQMDDGQLQQRIQTPCVLSIGDSPNTYMRVPTLKDRMRYRKRSIETLSIKDFQLRDETEELIDMEVIHHKRAGILIEGKSPEAKARKLYERHLKHSIRVKGRLVTN